LLEIIDSTCTNASLGTFGKDSIITSSGLCTNGDSASAFKFTAGGGVQYLNTSGAIGESYTIHVFFKFNDLGGYSRIIDFSNSKQMMEYIFMGTVLIFILMVLRDLVLIFNPINFI
jgi:hypothetical protein